MHHPAVLRLSVALLVVALAALGPDLVTATASPSAKLCKLVQQRLNVSEPLPEACGVVIVSGGNFLSLCDHMSTAAGVYGALRGYTGGGGGERDANATTYEAVCSEKTGLAEAVMVAFDFDQTTLRLLLDRWLGGHNPTVDGAYVGNYQNVTAAISSAAASGGDSLSARLPATEAPDVEYYGAQYRSAFFARHLQTESRVFRRAVKARNLTAPRIVPFDGVFVPEVQPAAALLAIRRRVPQPAQGVMLYQNRAAELRNAALAEIDVVADAAASHDDNPGSDLKPTPGVANAANPRSSTTDEDGVLQALDKLDREGKLAGAAADAAVATTTTTRAAVGTKKPKKTRRTAPTTTGAPSSDAESPTAAATAAAEHSPDEDDATTTTKPPKKIKRAAKTTTGAAETADDILPVTDASDAVDSLVETTALTRKRRTTAPKTTAAAADGGDGDAKAASAPESPAETTSAAGESGSWKTSTEPATTERFGTSFQSDDGVDMLVAPPPTPRPMPSTPAGRSRLNQSRVATTTNAASDDEPSDEPSTKLPRRLTAMKLGSIKRTTAAPAVAAAAEDGDDAPATTKAAADADDDGVAEAAPPPVVEAEADAE